MDTANSKKGLGLEKTGQYACGDIHQDGRCRKTLHERIILKPIKDAGIKSLGAISHSLYTLK
jgi:hypothetical protein